MTSVDVDIEFPTKLQPLFRPSRYKALYGGRGGAKSWGVARALLILGTQRPLRVLCAREYQNSIKDSVHKLLKDQIEALGLSHFYNVMTQKIEGLNGSEFSFEGLRQNVTRIKSYEAVDIAWVEEGQTVSKDSWDILVPTIRKDDSEIWVTFNPEFEDDATFERFVTYPPDDCIGIEINYRDNPWFPQVLEKERLSLLKRDPDSYDHIWEGKCRQWLTGAIYSDELRAAYAENRITRVAWDPDLETHTAWDIGHTDDTAIWWYQVAGNEIHILESYARTGGSPALFASQILGREVTINIVDGEIEVSIGADIDGLEHRQKYDYERHWLPHDARAKTLAAHGKSTQQQLQAALGYEHVRITPNLKVEDGLKAARSIFAACWFDERGTEEGMRALRRYRREEQRDGKSLQRSPKHDWTSHYADAFRYLAIAWQSPKADAPTPETDTDPWGRPRVADNWMVA